MAKAQWSIDNFLSEVNGRGLAKPARFEVIIDVPPCMVNTDLAPMAKTVSMYCDQASLPYSRVITSRQQIYGPPSLHPVGIEYNGENISMQFYVDREMRVKRFFDTWIDGIIDRTEHSTNYQRNYLTSITINQLDEADNVNYAVKLIDAFPTAVQALQLDNNAVNQVHRLNVSFAFRKWTEVTNFSQPAPETTKANGPAAAQNGVRIFNNYRLGVGPNFSGGEVESDNRVLESYFIIK